MNVSNGINCKLPFTSAWVVVHIIQFLPYKFITSTIFTVKGKFLNFVQLFIYFSCSFYASANCCDSVAANDWGICEGREFIECYARNKCTIENILL